MAAKTETQTTDTAADAKSAAPITTTAQGDELAAARDRVAVLEEQLAAADRDRKELVQRLDDAHQRDAERPELRMLSLFERLIAATEASALLSLATTQQHAGQLDSPQALRARAAALLDTPTG